MKTRLKILLIGILLISAVPILYGVVILLAWNGHRNTLGAFQADGLPVTEAELERSSKQSDSSVTFFRTMRHLEIESLDDLLPVDDDFCCTYTVYSGFSSEEIEAVDQRIEAHTPFIALLDELRDEDIQKPGVLSRYNSSDDAMIKFYMYTARLFGSASIIAAEKGDAAAAHDHLERLMWLNTVFESTPNLEHASAYYENRRLELSVVGYLLSTLELTTMQLQKIELHIQSFEHRDKLAQGIAGEHITTLNFYDWDRMYSLYMNAAEPELEFKLSLAETYLVPHRYFPLRRDYSERMLDWIHLSRQKDRLGVSLYDMMGNFSVSTAKSDFIPFQYSEEWVYYTMLRRLLLLAEHRITLTGLQVERYRRQEGKLPVTLDDIVPRFAAEIPTDPFTGAPLRGHGWRGYFGVYSLGQDKADAHQFKNGRQLGTHEGLEFHYLSPELLEVSRERNR